MRIADDELLSLAEHQMKPSTAWKFRQRLEQPRTAQSRTVALLYVCDCIDPQASAWPTGSCHMTLRH